MKTATAFVSGGDGLTAGTAAISCEALRVFHPLGYKSGPYWIKSGATQENVYCDMATGGGGIMSSFSCSILEEDGVNLSRKEATCFFFCLLKT